MPFTSIERRRFMAVRVGAQIPQQASYARIALAR
jgi:hypothetical protein